MEDLAWQFPAEAVERAAVRFCEAIAQWRGKPELETVRLPSSSVDDACLTLSSKYKKASWIVDGKDDRPPAASGSGGTGLSSGTAAMSIESLVHSNPTSPSTSNTLPTPVSATATAPDTRPRRPMIDRYFTMPPSFALHGRKRRREDGDRGDRDDGRRGHMPYA